jgi:arginine decarboxylase-like protein
LVWAAGRLFRMQSQQQRQKGGVRVSPELAEIVRSVSEADSRLPLARHIQIIEERSAQEAECFLRACAVRLRLEGGI